MVVAAILQNKKSLYLRNKTKNVDKIWHINASEPSACYQKKV